MISDNKYVLDEELFISCMEILDWDIKDYKKYQGKVLLKPDFYQAGFILASSTKAIIICDGSSVINYRDEFYEDFSDLLKKHGDLALEDYMNWHYEQEKEWLIRKFNGKFISTFSKMSQLKKRSEVRC